MVIVGVHPLRLQVFTMKFRNLEIGGRGGSELVRSSSQEPNMITPNGKRSPRLPGHLTMCVEIFKFFILNSSWFQ